MNDCIFASKLDDNAKNSLSEMGFDVIDFNKNRSVDYRVAHHADLSFFDCGDGTVFVAKEMAEYKSIIENLGYHVKIIDRQLGRFYPNDVLLNCVSLGDILVCNVNTVYKGILEHFSSRKIINVKQGYTKCSVIPINNRAIITDDESIAVKCEKCNIDVLYVHKGSVLLDGFDYGFIGGASGKVKNDTVVFNGDIATHSDCATLLSFFSKHNIKVVSLSNGKLKDIGSIIAFNRRYK